MEYTIIFFDCCLFVSFLLKYSLEKYRKRQVWCNVTTKWRGKMFWQWRHLTSTCPTARPELYFDHTENTPAINEGNAKPPEWKSKINILFPYFHIALSSFSLPLYSILSVQFTACLLLTEKPALNCKDKGTDLIVMPTVCVKHWYFRSETLSAAAVSEAFWVRC